jgi:hypothetical protein
VPADFVERLGDGAVDWDVEFWERVVSGIRNLRTLMTALIFDPFRGAGMLHFGYGETAP